MLLPSGRGLAAGFGHVADRTLPGRHDHLEVVGGAELRLVPGREEAARVGRLELGEQGPLRPLRVLIVEREQAGGLGVDPAAIVDASAGSVPAAIGRGKRKVAVCASASIWMSLGGRMTWPLSPHRHRASETSPNSSSAALRVIRSVASSTSMAMIACPEKRRLAASGAAEIE